MIQSPAGSRIRPQAPLAGRRAIPGRWWPRPCALGLAAQLGGALLAGTVLVAGAANALETASPGAVRAPATSTLPSPTTKTTAESLPMRLAEHLSRLGYIFYGAWWCPACQQQKQLFGPQAEERLPYVECERTAAGRERCTTAQIRAYPTWVRGGERREGVLTLEELQSWSGFRP